MRATLLNLNLVSGWLHNSNIKTSNSLISRFMRPPNLYLYLLGNFNVIFYPMKLLFCLQPQSEIGFKALIHLIELKVTSNPLYLYIFNSPEFVFISPLRFLCDLLRYSAHNLNQKSVVLRLYHHVIQYRCVNLRHCSEESPFDNTLYSFSPPYSHCADQCMSCVSII